MLEANGRERRVQLPRDKEIAKANTIKQEREIQQKEAQLLEDVVMGAKDYKEKQKAGQMR